MPQDQPGGDYNQLPYVSMPVTYSQPARLAAMAALHGLQAPTADTARVLEIGCASGGNIIPLAARFPRSRFLGLDLSVRHIEIGRQRIAALGLSNIELRQGDIATADLAGARFDYVICHGVYSWVPPLAQGAILRICGAVLADSGVAAISYNVLPGWHLRHVIRDISLQHAGDGTPRQRVANVRAFLGQLAETASESDPYGWILRAEAARLAQRTGSYILGELLAEHNTPCHVRDFFAAAGAHGLAYLGESDLQGALPEYLMPRAAERIRALAGEDPALLQHYCDVFSGRTFRSSLLIRAGRQAAPPAPGQLAGLSIASDLRMATPVGGGAPVFTDARKRPVPVSGMAVSAAFALLAQRYPATTALTELQAAGRGADSEAPAVADQAIEAAVFQLVAAGQATVSTLPLQAGTAAAPRPRAWAVSRADAVTGQPWVTSLQHAPVLLDPVLQVLLRHLDGRTATDGLARKLVEAVQARRLTLAELQPPTAAQPEVDLAQAAVAAVARTLARCARQGLLEP